MAFEFVEESGSLLVVKLRGKLTKADMDALQRKAVEVIQREGSVRVLVTAETFEGWDEKGDWGDLSFMMKYDEKIERIAVVGDKKWEDLTVAFTGKGMRSAQVEYFLPHQLAAARAWVTS
jgi:SpoIIAA-like